MRSTNLNTDASRASQQACCCCEETSDASAAYIRGWFALSNSGVIRLALHKSTCELHTSHRPSDNYASRYSAIASLQCSLRTCAAL